MSSVISGMSKNEGHDAAMNSGKVHFAAAAQRVAKLRSGNLQHGVPRHAPIGAFPTGTSSVSSGPGLTIQASESQTALNPKQRGATNKNAQGGSGHASHQDVHGAH